MSLDCDVYVVPSGSSSLWRLREKHCEQFMLRSKLEDGWQGTPIQQWAAWVTGHTYRALPRKALSYMELKEIISVGSRLRNEEVFLAIMAWSGMNCTVGRSAWQHMQLYVKTVAELRHGIITPVEAYAELSDAIRQLEKPGLSPAYFTKLIHFCSNTPGAYIMDQRTGASMNLLLVSAQGGEKPVLFNGARISSRNSSQDYERFCSLIDLLAELIGDVDGVTISRRFSSAAKRKAGPDEWWDYVIEQGAYTPTKHRGRRASIARR